MADLVASPVLQVIFDRLASPLLQKLGNMWNLTDNLEKLRRILIYVQTILEDAEERQVTDRDVTTWLSEMKCVVYNAEDLVDEITIVAFLDSAEQGSGMKLELLGTQYADKIREMVDKLETIRDEGCKFNLRERSMIKIRRETSSFVIESEVYGRHEDKENIVNMLLSTEHGVSCIPIVGLGGMGKTTLAQLVFNDERITQHFDVKKWVFVSDHYDAKDILVSLIQSTNTGTCQFWSMDALHSAVWGLLHKKRYLIVLDDVWLEDQEQWDKMRPLFGGDVDGSKIIITTRSRKVALMINSPISSYYLKGLSEAACWSLFMQYAFQPGGKELYPFLLPIGRQIVKKCGGVPLAVKTLGCLMRLRREEREWLDVLNSELLNLVECESGILPALRLSYQHLPLHLKRCFSFCSIIPRGYEIKKEKLIRQWMAAGLIHCSQKWEAIGNDYFNDLLWMSFFEEVKLCDDGGAVGYRMHGLIYDLAQSVAGTEFIILNHGSPAPRNFAQIRHSSVVCDFGSSMIPKELYEANHLRTLMLFAEGNFREVPHKLFSSFKYLRELDLSGCGLEVLDGSMGELLFLRYLDVSYTHIKSLPASIEKLRYLQTLNLSNCYNLEALPNLANMLSLRHLNNTGCVALSTMLPLNHPLNRPQEHHVPFTMEHRELINKVLPKVQNQLRTLPLIVVGSIKDLMLLERLDLQGSLKITHLENVQHKPDKGYKGLIRMNGVESLGLYWGDDAHSEEKSTFTRFQHRKEYRPTVTVRSIALPRRDAHTEYHHATLSEGLIGRDATQFKDLVRSYTTGSYTTLLEGLIDYLEPHKNLKTLRVKGYPGKMFPSWISTVIYLTAVELIDCTSLFRLPTLGNLMFLKSLVLRGMNRVSNIGEEFYGKSTIKPFLALRELAIIELPRLERWWGPGMDGSIDAIERANEDVFPSLSKLTINKCPKLWNVPEILSIEHLELRDCHETLVYSFRNLVSLSVLVIENVENLSSLPGEFLTNNPLLTSLEIKSCPHLCSLPVYWHVTSLKSLTIRWCENLSYLPKDFQYLNALESLEIGDCHKLVFFPEIGTTGFTKLRTLSIENCSNLTSLSMCLQNLTCLEHLVIMYCSSLVSLPQRLQHLVVLQSLSILGCCQEFKCLPKELQNLTRLNSLEIRSCPGLEALPDWIEKLVSLRSLAISDCQNITSLPEGIKRLTGLQHLSIQECPQLLERCRRENGEDWPNIVHVPYKHIGSSENRDASDEASSSSN